jgi:hypothetical protein
LFRKTVCNPTSTGFIEAILNALFTRISSSRHGNHNQRRDDTQINNIGDNDASLEDNFHDDATEAVPHSDHDPSQKNAAPRYLQPEALSIQTILRRIRLGMSLFSVVMVVVSFVGLLVVIDEWGGLTWTRVLSNTLGSLLDVIACKTTPRATRECSSRNLKAIGLFAQHFLVQSDIFDLDRHIFGIGVSFFLCERMDVLFLFLSRHWLSRSHGQCHNLISLALLCPSTIPYGDEWQR